MIQNKRPEDVSLGGQGHMNRTGIDTAPLQGKEMVEGATGETKTDGKQLLSVRRFYIEEAEPVGTMPPPASVKGVVSTVKDALTGSKATVLIDKIAERLAFERTGTRFYDALLTKFEILGSFDGGPTRADLQKIRDEELSHFHLLTECMRSIGADPTAVTPSADLAGVEGMGIGQVLGDPRTTLAQGLHAILVAEVADRAGWELLIEVADGMGQQQFVERFRAAEAQELQHVASVKRWLGAHCAVAGGFTQKPATATSKAPETKAGVAPTTPARGAKKSKK